MRLYGAEAMTTDARKTVGPSFRPRSQALALEPRILFDGAAAVAIGHQPAGIGCLLPSWAAPSRHQRKATG